MFVGESRNVIALLLRTKGLFNLLVAALALRSVQRTAGLSMTLNCYKYR